MNSKYNTKLRPVCINVAIFEKLQLSYRTIVFCIQFIKISPDFKLVHNGSELFFKIRNFDSLSSSSFSLFFFFPSLFSKKCQICRRQLTQSLIFPLAVATANRCCTLLEAGEKKEAEKKEVKKEKRKREKEKKRK